MKRKRPLSLLVISLMLLLTLPAAAETTLTAEALYMEFVAAGMRLTVDPQTDPLLTLVQARWQEQLAPLPSPARPPELALGSPR